MNKEEAAKLLEKYLAGTCTPEEYGMLIRAYNLEIPFNAAEPGVNEYKESMKLVLTRLQEAYPEIRSKRIAIWPMMAKVAAAIMVLAVCVYFFKEMRYQKVVHKTELTRAIQDVEPGKNTARLTLANGKTIELSDKKTGIVIGSTLTYDDHTAVSSKEELELEHTVLTASTPRGGTYQFTLPDGTSVWLNADSKISFPYRFSRKIREINLDGEAYFEVAKDKSRPFIVKTAGQEIAVFGTHFNVKSYQDEPEVKTTLIEGSVKVTPTGHLGRMLVPGQQAVVTTDGIKVVEADVNMAIAWKNGDFFFYGQDMEEVMRTIARWYDVEVIYKVSPDQIRLDGEVSRSKKLSTILKVLEGTGQNRFSITDKKIIVTR